MIIVYDVKGGFFEINSRRWLAKGDKVRVLLRFDVGFLNKPDGSLVGRSHSFNLLIDVAAMQDLEERLVRSSEISAALLAPKSSTGAEASLMEDAREIFDAAAAIVCNEPKPSLGCVLQVLTSEVASDDCKCMFAVLAPRASDLVSKEAMLFIAGQDNKQLGLYLSVLMSSGLNAGCNLVIVRGTKTNDFAFESMRWEPQTCYLSIPGTHNRCRAGWYVCLSNARSTPCVATLWRRARISCWSCFCSKSFFGGKMHGALNAVTTLPSHGGRLCLIVQAPEALREFYCPAGEEILTESSHLHV